MSDQSPQAVANNFGPLTQSILTAAMRWILAGAAGYLIKLGVMTADQTTQFETIGVAVLMGLSALAWSIIQKRQAHKVIDAVKTQ